MNEGPIFVTGPFGDYYLSQIAANNPADPWPVQGQDSPAVNAGSDYANNLGMHEYTTRTDDSADAFDKGMVDMGYHYQLIKSIERCSIADVFADGRIDIGDLAEISMYWFRQSCSPGDGWCGATDFNEDTEVDSKDLIFMVKCWLAEDTAPPLPNPAEWAEEPSVVTTTTVSMTARIAFDGWWGEQVEYIFEQTKDTNYDSGWRQGYDPGGLDYFAEPHIWIDTGLTPGTQYTYRVIVRDKSELQTHEPHETQPSIEISVVPGADVNPPAPVEWATKIDDGIYGLPYPTDPITIRMIARVAIDPEGSNVQYRFRGVAGTTAGNEGLDSDWQDSAQWNVTVVDIYLDGYTFEFQVRDEIGNVSAPSQQATAPIDPDWNPPEPDPAEWATWPMKYLDQTLWYHYMAAEVATDASGVMYEFELVSGQGQGSGGPQIEPDHLVLVGTNVVGTYRVRYVDDSPLENKSQWSIEDPT